MALCKKILTEYGINVDDGYFRIDELSVENKTIARIVVNGYANKDKKSLTSKSYVFEYDLNGANPYVQGYQYLKTTPEFKDAHDI